MKKLIIYRDSTILPVSIQDTKVISFADLKQDILDGNFFHYLRKFPEVELSTFNQDFFPRPLNTLFLLKLIAIKTAYIHDEQDNFQQITVFLLIDKIHRALQDFWSKKKIFMKIDQDLRSINNFVLLDIFLE